MDGDETPVPVAVIVKETRELLRSLDDVPWPSMDVLFYMHGYDERHIALERLLEALARESSDA